MRLETTAPTNETDLDQNEIEPKQEVIEERLIENTGIAFNERPPSGSFASPELGD